MWSVLPNVNFATCMSNIIYSTDHSADLHSPAATPAPIPSRPSSPDVVRARPLRAPHVVHCARRSAVRRTAHSHLSSAIAPQSAERHSSPPPTDAVDTLDLRDAASPALSPIFLSPAKQPPIESTTNCLALRRSARLVQPSVFQPPPASTSLSLHVPLSAIEGSSLQVILLCP